MNEKITFNKKDLEEFINSLLTDDSIGTHFIIKEDGIYNITEYNINHIEWSETSLELNSVEHDKNERYYF